MVVKHVEAFGDSLLVVQQIVGNFHCLDGFLNAYLDKCLEIIALFNDFTVQHIFKHKNTVVNILVQQASDFRSNWGKLYVLENWMFQFPNQMFWFSADVICCNLFC
jgi:hypothetical protein